MKLIRKNIFDLKPCIFLWGNMDSYFFPSTYYYNTHRPSCHNGLCYGYSKTLDESNLFITRCEPHFFGSLVQL